MYRRIIVLFICICGCFLSYNHYWSHYRKKTVSLHIEDQVFCHRKSDMIMLFVDRSILRLIELTENTENNAHKILNDEMICIVGSDLEWFYWLMDICNKIGMNIYFYTDLHVMESLDIYNMKKILTEYVLQNLQDLIVMHNLDHNMKIDLRFSYKKEQSGILIKCKGTMIC